MISAPTDKILAIGLMSGTSVDGIDAALVEISDRHNHIETNLIAGHTYAYPDDLRAEILAVCAGKRDRYSKYVNSMIALPRVLLKLRSPLWKNAIGNPI